MDNNTLFQAISNMPSELSGPVPRTIRPSDGARVLQFVLALLIGVIVVLGLRYCKLMVIDMQHRSALRQDGVDAQGEVTFLDRVGKGANIVRYTFQTKDGTVSGKAEVPAELMQELGESTRITIRYLPYNPSINHPAAWEWSLLSQWSVPLILGGLFTVWVVTFTAMQRGRKLLVWGKPASGVVTNCRESGRGAISVKYEFRTEAGIPVTGSGSSSERREIGERVLILYLPQKPRRNCPYPVADFYIE